VIGISLSFLIADGISMGGNEIAVGPSVGYPSVDRSICPSIWQSIGPSVGPS